MQKATIERIESFMLQEIKYKNVQMYQLYKLLLWIDIMIAPVANCHSVLLGVSPMLPSKLHRGISIETRIAGRCRYSESLPASLHPSPAPMAPIHGYLRLHLAIRGISCGNSWQNQQLCFFGGALLHVAWCISPLDLADAVSFLQPASIGLT